MVSVIVPTYNRAHLVREAIESVLAQTRQDYEILIVDDGSDDHTREALAGVMSHITYRRIPHSGASAARNVGLEMSSGERIAFLDSDDVWHARFLEKMEAALDAAPWAGFAYCDYEMAGPGGTLCAACLPAGAKIRGNIFARLLQDDFIATGAIVIRRECLAGIGGFDPRLRVAHDWDVWLRLARRHAAECVDEPLVRIRSHPGSLTQDEQAICADNLLILSKIRTELGRDAEHLPILRQNAARFHRSMAHHLRKARRPLPAFLHLALAAVAHIGGPAL